MLNLARRIGETVIIGNNIRIKVIAVQGKTVKLGIEAPDEISIHREEVYVKLMKEQEQYLKRRL